MTGRPAKVDLTSSAAALECIAEEARERLAQLEPFLEEADRLRGALAALGPEAPVPKPAHTPARKVEILAIVAEHPGITVAEISRRYGMKRAVVASSISRLKRGGQVVYRRGGVHLPRAEPEGTVL